MFDSRMIIKLNKKIDPKSVNRKVCVFGQGFVGLPLALSFALMGCSTIGVDINSNLVKNINNGLTDSNEKFCDVTIQDILKFELKNKRYIATTEGDKAVKECNNIIVTVGIPIEYERCVIEHLQSACRVIGKNIKADDLVIIRSTVVPGTTESVVLPILEEESGMKAGRDFYLAYASERIAEGRAFEEFENMPTIVGGINKISLDKAVDLLSIVCKTEIITTCSIKAVEASKVFENVQRDVNIAMMQEFARLAEALGIDIFDMVKLANTHKRVNLLIPGPGVGGYCIPNAYYYLKPKAEELNVNIDLLKLSRQKNDYIPDFIVNKIEELLMKVNKNIKDSKVAVLGLAMKDYSNDDRKSPAVKICKILIAKGAHLKAFDPAVSTQYDFKVNTEEEALKDADAVVILARQDNIILSDAEYMAKYTKQKSIFIDTKAVMEKNEATKCGFIYWRI